MGFSVVPKGDGHLWKKKWLITAIVGECCPADPKNNRILPANESDKWMTAYTCRSFSDGQQIGACGNDLSVMDRHPLASITWQQTIAHREIGLLVRDEIRMKAPALIRGKVGGLHGKHERVSFATRRVIRPRLAALFGDGISLYVS
jgi:hypothetical protein